jgi:hypothetical protein
VEEKGPVCAAHLHRRNHTIAIAPRRAGSRRARSARSRSAAPARPAPRRAILARMRCLASLPAPFAPSRRRHDPRVLPRRLPRSPGPPRAGFGRRRRHVPALQPRHPLPVVRRHAAPRGLPALDAALARRVARVLAPDGSLFLNVGAKPPIPGPGSTSPGWPAGVHAPEHDPLDQVDRHRRGRRRRRGASTATSPSATTSPSTAPRFVNDCHEYVFHFTQHGETALDRTAIGVPYQDKSNVTRWAAAGRRPPLPRQHVVPALRRRSRAATRTARTRRRSRRGCPSSASGSTAASAPPRDRSRSPAWAARPSPAPASTSTSPASTSTTSTWPKPSAARGASAGRRRRLTVRRGRRLIDWPRR